MLTLVFSTRAAAAAAAGGERQATEECYVVGLSRHCGRWVALMKWTWERSCGRIKMIPCRAPLARALAQSHSHSHSPARPPPAHRSSFRALDSSIASAARSQLSYFRYSASSSSSGRLGLWAIHRWARGSALIMWCRLRNAPPLPICVTAQSGGGDGDQSRVWIALPLDDCKWSARVAWNLKPMDLLFGNPPRDSSFTLKSHFSSGYFFFEKRIRTYARILDSQYE